MAQERNYVAKQLVGLDTPKLLVDLLEFLKAYKEQDAGLRAIPRMGVVFYHFAQPDHEILAIGKAGNRVQIHALGQVREPRAFFKLPVMQLSYQVVRGTRDAAQFRNARLG